MLEQRYTIQSIALGFYKVVIEDLRRGQWVWASDVCRCAFKTQAERICASLNVTKDYSLEEIKSRSWVAAEMV